MERSAGTRGAYLGMIGAAARRGPTRTALSCSNLAHGFAACDVDDKDALKGDAKANVAIVSAYNDMLSAHKPFESYPALIKEACREAGAVAQFAGGVPAMCDGVTQGQPGMELSLFSRDVIAMASAVALSHDMFDGALFLGVCDKIVPGMVMAAASFGHLPAIFVPAGPMTSGLSNPEKAKVRQLYAEGKVGRAELLEAESQAYHGPGTCTFYGTANSNQMLVEIMGLHLPGASFINPESPMRAALTKAAARRVGEITALGNDYTPVGEILSEKTFVNAMVGLHATGGSTNHTIHLIAMAKAAGIQLTWDDFSDLSDIIPLLCRVYPNGLADVNHFQAAGGLAFVIRQLLDAGLLHDDVKTVQGGLANYTREPRLDNGDVIWDDGPSESLDKTIVTSIDAPFSTSGGLKLLTGNLGRAVIKTSAVKPEHRIVEAPAVLFEDQSELQNAFKAGKLEQDFIAVVRFQGPKANGMPELHKLTPPLGVLQDKGFKVALVTDGRMSGASGKVPAAIHVTPEASGGSGLTKLRDGDPIRLDAAAGTLDALVDEAEWNRREPVKPDLAGYQSGLGRELFSISAAKLHQPNKVLPPSASSEPEMTLDQIMRTAPVIPVMVIDDIDHAVPLARALVDGGLKTLEITLRTSIAMDAIRAILSEVEGAIVVPARCFRRNSWKRSVTSVANSPSSPGFTPALLDSAAEMPCPLLPGAATATEIMQLLERGHNRLKFFPAEAAGGAAFLKSIASPLPDAKFCPTGGIGTDNAASYLELPSVLCVGGSWVAPKEAIASGDWGKIEGLAAKAARL